MNLYSYWSTHGISGLAAGGAWEKFKVCLRMTIEWNQKYTLRPWSREFGHALGGRGQVNSEMHFEAVIEQVWRCNWGPRLSELWNALGGCDQASVEMHWETVIERVSTCNWRPRLSELRHALGGRNRASWEMDWEAMITWVSRYTLRPWWSEVADALGGQVWASLDMELETKIEWTQRYTLRPWSSKFGDALLGGYDRGRLEKYLEVVDLEAADGWRARCWDSIHRWVHLIPWECDKVTLPLKLLWRFGRWRSIGRKVRCKLMLHSGVASKSWEWRDDRKSQVYTVLSVCCTRFMLHSVLTHDDGMER